MRKIFRVLLGLVALLAVALLSAPIWVDGVARGAVQAAASGALGVETTLQKLDLSLFGGTCEIAGLRVANPRGFTTPHFLALSRGAVAVNVRSVLGDKVEIPTLVLDGVDVNLEKGKDGANYDVILANMKKGEEAPEEGGRKFVIREVVVKNVRAHAKLVDLGVVKPTIPVEIDEIRLRNVGEGGEAGIGLGLVIEGIVTGVLRGIARAGKGVLPDDMMDGLGKGLGALAGAGREGVEVIGKGGKAVVEGVTQAIDGLFGRKKRGEEGDE
jgi:hypothetical protein